jgi:hypothetical protein
MSFITNGKLYFFSLLFIHRILLLYSKALTVYENMLINDQEIWSSTINCQQFAHRFVVDALGLDWLNNINIVDDALPISIDIGILRSSKRN